MEWIITIVAIVAAWYFYTRASGDTDLKKVRAFTYILERFGAKLHGVDQHRFNSIVSFTTSLRIGIHALKHGQAFMLNDDVLEAYKVVVEEEGLWTMLGISAAKTSEFRNAFKNCYERLRVMYGRDTKENVVAPVDKSSAKVQAPDELSSYPSGTLLSKEKPKVCPECGGGKVAVIKYGMPTDDPKLHDDEAKGKIVFGGCVIGSLSAAWQCVECDTQIFRG